MMRDIAKLVGALGSGTGVLLGLLIDKSLELRLLSAVVLAAVPAAAALVLGATLVCLLKLLGIVYDLLRTLLLPRLMKLASRYKGDFGRVLIWGAGRLIRFKRACVIWLGQILRSTQTRARTGLGWVSREIALEALCIKHRTRRLKDLAPFTAGWPIRSSARLLLRLKAKREVIAAVSTIVLRCLDGP